MFIDVLSEVVATGLRKLFSIITFDGLVRDVSSTIHWINMDIVLSFS